MKAHGVSAQCPKLVASFSRNPEKFIYMQGKFDSSHNPVFIGKYLNYASNWLIISIIVSLQKNNVSLLKVSSFLSARFSLLSCRNELLASSCPKFIYCVLCSSPTFATVGIYWSEASRWRHNNCRLYS